jgi:hypothetical protein
MPPFSRSRWILAAACATVPALTLLTACGSDSATSPKSVAAADTVAIDQAGLTIIDRWVRPGSDSGFESFSGISDGDYVEAYPNDGNTDDYRMLVPFTLPTLAGRGVVDSAKVYEYVCRVSGTFADSIVVDHVNWGAAYLDSASYFGQILQANIGTLVRDDSAGWHSVSVTSAVQADYAAKRASSQFRFEWLYSTFPTNDTWVEFVGSYCGGTTLAAAGEGYLVIWSH